MRLIVAVSEEAFCRPDETLDARLHMQFFLDLAQDRFVGAFPDFGPATRQRPVTIGHAPVHQKMTFMEDQGCHTKAEELRLVIQPDHVARLGIAHLSSRLPSSQTTWRVEAGKFSISAAMK